MAAMHLKTFRVGVPDHFPGKASFHIEVDDGTVVLTTTVPKPHEHTSATAADRNLLIEFMLQLHR